MSPRRNGAQRRSGGDRQAGARSRVAAPGADPGERLTIGDAARLSGVPPKTIRYYEEIRLLPRPRRARNHYRVYDQRAVQFLRFIKRSRDLGFSIERVRRLLALWQDAQRESAEVKRLAREHIAAIDDKIDELQALRDAVQSLVDRCHGDHRPDCPIIDDLADQSRRRT